VYAHRPDEEGHLVNTDRHAKIRALLVKARHAGTPEHEASLSQAMAEKLALKYGIDLMTCDPDAVAERRCIGCGRVAHAEATSAAANPAEYLCWGCALDAMFRMQAAEEAMRSTPAPAAPTCTRTYAQLRAYLRDEDTCLDCGRRVVVHPSSKVRIDHSGCAHDTTPAARAKCRRARARGGA
jgi:hypothetical protein